MSWIFLYIKEFAYLPTLVILEESLVTDTQMYYLHIINFIAADDP